MQEKFRCFATAVSRAAGSSWAFLAAVLIVILWGVSKPLFPDLNGWMLVINTMTTIITFIMVFVIQNSQNRDISALHVKLDELIRVTKSARNKLAGAEELPDHELKKFHKEFVELTDEEEEPQEKK